MPGLLLGPLLRYTGSTQATVWVETDGPCEVAVLAARAIEGSSVARAYEVVGGAVQRVVEPDKERTLLWDRLSYRHDRALAAVRRFYDDDLQEEA